MGIYRWKCTPHCLESNATKANVYHVASVKKYVRWMLMLPTTQEKEKMEQSAFYVWNASRAALKMLYNKPKWRGEM